MNINIIKIYKPFSHLLILTLSGSMFSQYHTSSLCLHASPLSHNPSSVSSGSLLHGSPMALRHTSQQPHLSLTTAVLQFVTGGHAYLGSGQSPALLHQHAEQSGTRIGVCAVMYDRNTTSNDADEKKFVIAATN